MFIFYPKSSEWMKDSRSKDLDFFYPSFIIVRYCLTLLSTNWNFISTFPSLKKKHFSSLFVDSRGELYFQPTWQLPIGWCDRVFIFAMAGYFRYANEVPRFRGRSKVNRSQRPETVWRDWKEKRKAASDWWPTVEEANQEPCFFLFPGPRANDSIVRVQRHSSVGRWRLRIAYTRPPVAGALPPARRFLFYRVATLGTRAWPSALASFAMDASAMRRDWATRKVHFGRRWNLHDALAQRAKGKKPETSSSAIVRHSTRLYYLISLE